MRLGLDRVRVVGGTAVLLSLGIAANCSPYLADRRAAAAQGVQPDAITQDEQRVETLALWLPAQGTIGYLQPLDWPSADAQRRFYVAEYALAPRVIVMSTAPEFVIATPEAFAGPDALHSTSTDPRLADHVVYRQSGNGLRIFRRIR
jgi:hypothetical protein